MADNIEITDTKTVWVAWGNTDGTEGRGHNFPLAVCESEFTARRLGRGNFVQGSDCPVREAIAVRVGFQWLVPGVIKPPSKEDIEEERKVSEELDKKRKVEAAIERAREAGLTDEDLALIRGGD